MAARAKLDTDRVEDVGRLLEQVSGILGLLSSDLEHAATVGTDVVLATYGVERLVKVARQQLSAVITELYAFNSTQEGRA